MSHFIIGIIVNTGTVSSPGQLRGGRGRGRGSESVQGAVYQQTRCDGWCRTIFYMFLLSKIFTWHQCHEYTHTLVHHLQNDSHKHPQQPPATSHQPPATRCSCWVVDNVRMSMIIWDDLFCLGELFDTLQFCREMFCVWSDTPKIYQGCINPYLEKAGRPQFICFSGLYILQLDAVSRVPRQLWSQECCCRIISLSLWLAGWCGAPRKFI